MERLDGKAVAAAYKEEIRQKLAEKQAAGQACGLAIVRCGSDVGAEIYARSMKKAAEALGFEAVIHELPEEAAEAEMEALLDRLNADEAVSGILPMMPWPDTLDRDRLINRIRSDKDIDGLTDLNIARVVTEKGGFAPCTAQAVMAILTQYEIDLEGRHVVIVGRSHVVGRPLVQLCLQRHATVTVCHSKTKNLAELTRTADILISAVGKAECITGEMIKPGAVVIDVGINRKDGRVVGDVDAASIEGIAAAYTPVPGGVGAVTTTMVLQGLIK